MSVAISSCRQYSPRKVRMERFRSITVNLLVIAGLLFVSVVHADSVAIKVYKGELRLVVPSQQARDSLLVQYRSKSREVVRVGVNGLLLTSTTTKEVKKLPDQSASLSNRYDHEGYWNTDINYTSLDLGNDDYRVQGRLTLYLVGSQRTRSFDVYLKAESSSKPPGSTIDWEG
jgi:hypothetical protein